MKNKEFIFFISILIFISCLLIITAHASYDTVHNMLKQDIHKFRNKRVAMSEEVELIAKLIAGLVERKIEINSVKVDVAFEDVFNDVWSFSYRDNGKRKMTIEFYDKDRQF